MRINRLRREQLEKGVGAVCLGGQEPGRPSFRVVFAADERANAWAERAYDGGDGGAELDDVGHGEAVLVVFCVPFVGLFGNGGEAVVVGAGHFVGKEDA
jgi:hypothetical protein